MSDAPAYRCDMHCHTLRSDGNDTPRELIDNAVALGLHAIGLTDHDIDPPRTIPDQSGREVDLVAYAAGRGLVLVPGYEFSCDTHVDDVHICGYGLDWDHADLQAEVQAAFAASSRARTTRRARSSAARRTGSGSSAGARTDSHRLARGSKTISTQG